jgi:hypothetical protein
MLDKMKRKSTMNKNEKSIGCGYIRSGLKNLASKK